MAQELVKMDDWYEQIIHALRETKHVSLADAICGKNGEAQGGREDRQRGVQVEKEGSGGERGRRRRNEGGSKDRGQGGGKVRSAEVENRQGDQEERGRKIQNSERLNSSKSLIKEDCHGHFLFYVEGCQFT